jgi:hypothetical protein
MRLILAVVIMLVACGCTRTPPGPSFSDIDEAKMSQIEERAARSGVRVYWLNPPRKASASGG